MSRRRQTRRKKPPKNTGDKIILPGDDPSLYKRRVPHRPTRRHQDKRRKAERKYWEKRLFEDD